MLQSQQKRSYSENLREVSRNKALLCFFLLTCLLCLGYALLTMEGVTASALIHKLFNPINYLTRYKHFINIVTSTSTINNHEAW